jgi:hypothetical protein
MGDAAGAARGRAAWLLFGVIAAASVLALTVAGARGSSSPRAYELQYAPSVAFDGTNYLVVWQGVRDTPFYDIYAARVSPSGAVLDPGGLAISTAEREQLTPTVAFDGTNYFVAWADYRSGSNTDIYGTRVTPAGAVLDPGGIPISTPTDYQDSPALSFDGTNYLVAWRDCCSDAGIYGARVSPAGAVLDPSGIPISSAANEQRDPSVAFDGSNYLVAWGERGYDIYGARVTSAGAVLDPSGIAISTAAGFQESPALAFGGSNYLVAWQRSPDGGPEDIYGARVTPAGAVLDPGGIAITTASYRQRAAGVAFDGTNYLVAWEDSRSGTNWDTYGGRVSQAGAALDPGGIAIATAAQERTPTLAFDGTNYLIAWENYSFGYVIYGSRVSPAGAILDPSGIPIGAAPPAPPPPPPPPPPPMPPPPPPPPVRCKVPRVIGLRLAPARRRIRARHCSVGRVRRARSKRVGRVIGQKPRPGTVKRRGFPVNLVVGRSSSR